MVAVWSKPEDKNDSRIDILLCLKSKILQLFGMDNLMIQTFWVLLLKRLPFVKIKGAKSVEH